MEGTDDCPLQAGIVKTCFIQAGLCHLYQITLESLEDVFSTMNNTWSTSAQKAFGRMAGDQGSCEPSLASCIRCHIRMDLLSLVSVTQRCELYGTIMLISQHLIERLPWRSGVYPCI